MNNDQTQDECGMSFLSVMFWLFTRSFGWISAGIFCFGSHSISDLFTYASTLDPADNPSLTHTESESTISLHHPQPGDPSSEDSLTISPSDSMYVCHDLFRGRKLYSGDLVGIDVSAGIPSHENEDDVSLYQCGCMTIRDDTTTFRIGKYTCISLPLLLSLGMGRL